MSLSKDTYHLEYRHLYEQRITLESRSLAIENYRYHVKCRDSNIKKSLESLYKANNSMMYCVGWSHQYKTPYLRESFIKKVLDFTFDKCISTKTHTFGKSLISSKNHFGYTHAYVLNSHNFGE